LNSPQEWLEYQVESHPQFIEITAIIEARDGFAQRGLPECLSSLLAALPLPVR
jgi:hypothetical protein